MSALTLPLLTAVLAQTPPGAMPSTVGSGVIHGGWGYVWTAYGIFWAGLALYALSLILRSRAARLNEGPKEQA